MPELDELFSGNLENVEIVRREASEPEQDIRDRSERPVNPDFNASEISTTAGDIEYFDWKQVLKNEGYDEDTISAVERYKETKSWGGDENVEYFDWKQVLKNEGYDDFSLGALEYYRSTGDLAAYIEAKSIDYSAMPDEEILRRDLRRVYSDLSDEDFNLVYQSKVVDKYKLDDVYGEDEQRVGRIELKYAVKDIREKLIEEQKRFAPPAKPEQVDQQQERDMWFESVKSDPATQDLLSGKRISSSTGANFEVNPNVLLDQTYDTNKFFQNFVDQNGKTDLNKWYKALAFVNNMEAYEKTIWDAARSEGKKELFNEIKNPAKPDVGQVPRGGTGDFKADLLQAFLESGRHRG